MGAWAKGDYTEARLLFKRSLMRLWPIRSLSWREWKRRSLEKEVGTADVSYGYNLKRQANDPFLTKAYGIRWFEKHQIPTQLLRVSWVSFCLSHETMISTGQDSFLNLKEPYYFLALFPWSWPITLSSSIPIFLHFLVFHALSHLYIFTYTLPFPWDHTSQLAPGEIMCKLQDPFTYHLLLEDLSDTPRSFTTFHQWFMCFPL